MEGPLPRREPETADPSRLGEVSKTPGLQYAAVNAAGILVAFTAGVGDLRRGTSWTRLDQPIRVRPIGQLLETRG